MHIVRMLISASVSAVGFFFFVILDYVNERFLHCPFGSASKCLKVTELRSRTLPLNRLLHSIENVPLPHLRTFKISLSNICMSQLLFKWKMLKAEIIHKLRLQT